LLLQFEEDYDETGAVLQRKVRAGDVVKQPDVWPSDIDPGMVFAVYDALSAHAPSTAATSERLDAVDAYQQFIGGGRGNTRIHAVQRVPEGMPLVKQVVLPGSPRAPLTQWHRWPRTQAGAEPAEHVEINAAAPVEADDSEEVDALLQQLTNVGDYGDTVGASTLRCMRAAHTDSWAAISTTAHAMLAG
jgi:hypothetical protein